MNSTNGTGRVGSVSSQAIFLASASAGAQVIVAIMYILTARGSDPAIYGQTVTAISIGMATVGFIDFGTNQLWVRELASERRTVADLSRSVSGKLAIAAGVGLIGGLALLALRPALASAAVIFLAGIVSQTMLVPLRAARRGERVAALLLLERLMALVFFAVLTRVGFEPTFALWVSLACGTTLLAAATISVTPLRSRFRAQLPNSNPWKGSAHFGASTIAASAQQLDLAVLGAMAGPTAAGIYGSVNRWTQPMSLLANAFSVASTPFVARAGTWTEARRDLARASWILAVAIAVCAVVILAAPMLVSFLLGAAYMDAVPVLQWLAAGTMAAVLNQPLASSLQARHYDRAVGIGFLACAALQLSLVALLAPTLMATGAAIAFFVLQTSLLTCLLVVLTVAMSRERKIALGEDTA